jgi:hypothetical protein
VKKIVLLVILAGLALWYFDFSRRMTEQSIATAYQAQARAMNAMDAAYLCSHMASGYQSTEVLHGPRGTTTRTMGKDQACTQLTRMAGGMQKLGIAPGGMISPRYSIEIKHVELAANRKAATVEAVATMMVGDVLLMRSYGTEQLIRRVGRIQTLGSESETWVYGRH